MQRKYAFGFVLLLVSALLFSVMGACVKLASNLGIGSYELLFYRFLIGTAFVILFAFLGIARLEFVRKGFLIWRGLLGGAMVFILFISIQKIGLGRSAVLSYTFPIFAALYAPFLLKEKVNLLVILAIAAAFFGLYLMSPLGGARIISWFYFSLALGGGGVIGGLCVIVIKKLRETDNSYTIYLSQAFFGLLMATAFTFGKRIDFPTGGWYLILAVGLLATFGQLIMTYAYKFVPATQAGLLAMLTPVFNMVIAMGFLQEEMSRMEITGAVLVILSCFSVFYFESRKKKVKAD